MKSIFTNEQVEYLKANYEKNSYKDIAVSLGFTEKQIRGKINGMGLSKKRKFHKSYFEEILNPNQAYWLGFIYADGYLTIGKNRTSELGIELKRDDEYLLSLFNNELGGVHKIYRKHSKKEFNGYKYETDSSLIRVYSNKIVNDLNRHGITDKKTYKKEYPKCDYLFYDFLRGFIDGDGCLYVNRKKLMNIQLTNANIKFLEYLKDTVSRYLKIEGSIYKEKDLKYRLVYFRQSDAKLLLDKLYENKDCVKLERKYSIYKSYYGLPN